MIQTVHFKLYCYVKMHKMGKLLKNCGGRVLQDNLMKSGPLKSALETLLWGSVYIINLERDEMRWRQKCPVATI